MNQRGAYVMQKLLLLKAAIVRGRCRLAQATVWETVMWCARQTGALFWAVRVGIFSIALAQFATASSAQENLAFPRLMKTRYEAADAQKGGHVVIWFEREKIWYGLDQRIFPSAIFVEVIHIVPSTGSPPVTFIEVRALNALVSDHYHVTGNVRLRTSGMTVKSSNAP